MAVTRCIPDRFGEFFRTSGKGRRRLLWLTYRFDPRALQRHLGGLLARGVQVDVVTGSNAGRDVSDGAYRVWRAVWPRTFHPKLAVALADNRVEAGLGSANLTMPGFRDNLECWAHVGPDEPALLSGVRAFLEALSDKRVVSRRAGLDEIVAALPKPSGKEESPLLSTLRPRDVSLVEQMGRRLRGEVDAITLVSPLYADAQDVVDVFMEQFKPRRIELRSDGVGGRLPRLKHVAQDGYFVLEPPPGPDVDRRIECVHAKLYAFHRGNRVDVFWGSANLSRSALLRTGRRANVELLVQSQMSSVAWKRFLSRVPDGHTWRQVRPSNVALPPADETSGEGWRLLQAVWDGAKLVLESTGSGRLRLGLRSDCRREGILRSFDFSDGAAAVSTDDARSLGFCAYACPRTLEWREGRGPWSRIHVNDLTEVPGIEGPADAVEILFALYSGRLLPGRGPVGHRRLAAMPGEKVDSEESELTRCDHQGSLDRFVLAWRMVAKRIAAASAGNTDLWRRRVADALARFDADARRQPGAWRAEEREFVKRVLEAAWRA